MPQNIGDTKVDKSIDNLQYLFRLLRYDYGIPSFLLIVVIAFDHGREHGTAEN